MGEISAFSWKVIDNIQKLIARKGITDAQVIAVSGIPRNTFYRKMRGDTPFTTDDLDKLARALDVDPAYLMLSRAEHDLVANESINEFPEGDDADWDQA